MPRILLVLPTATYRAPDFLEAARVLGVEVVVASEHDQTMPMGDRAVTVDLCDAVASAERIVALNERTPIDAVIGVDEQGVLIAAHAALALGLAHNSPEAVATTRSKARMRHVLTQAGLVQPAARVTGPRDDVARAAAEIGLPCVVKATVLSGSRGVIRADTPDEAVRAAVRVRAILRDADEDPDGPVLVERFVTGAEVAVEGLLRGGELQVLAIFDKPDPLDGPYFEETIYVTPSRAPSGVQEEITAGVARACEAIGLVEGPIHAELRLDDAGPLVLEIAARSIGGLCSRALRFGADMSLEEIILRHALSLEAADLRRTKDASGVMMIPIPRPGVLRAVGGLDDARAVVGVDGVEITVPVGQTVRTLPEGDRYLGFVFASGASPSDVEASLRDAHARLRTEID